MVGGTDPSDKVFQSDFLNLLGNSGPIFYYINPQSYSCFTLNSSRTFKKLRERGEKTNVGRESVKGKWDFLKISHAIFSVTHVFYRSLL